MEIGKKTSIWKSKKWTEKKVASSSKATTSLEIFFMKKTF